MDSVEIDYYKNIIYGSKNEIKDLIKKRISSFYKKFRQADLDNNQIKRIYVRMNNSQNMIGNIQKLSLNQIIKRESGNQDSDSVAMEYLYFITKMLVEEYLLTNHSVHFHC